MSRYHSPCALLVSQRRSDANTLPDDPKSCLYYVVWTHDLLAQRFKAGTSAPRKMALKATRSPIIKSVEEACLRGIPGSGRTYGWRRFTPGPAGLGGSACPRGFSTSWACCRCVSRCVRRVRPLRAHSSPLQDSLYHSLDYLAHEEGEVVEQETPCTAPSASLRWSSAIFCCFFR